MPTIPSTISHYAHVILFLNPNYNDDNVDNNVNNNADNTQEQLNLDILGYQPTNCLSPLSTHNVSFCVRDNMKCKLLCHGYLRSHDINPNDIAGVVFLFLHKHNCTISFNKKNIVRHGDGALIALKPEISSLILPSKMHLHKSGIKTQELIRIRLIENDCNTFEYNYHFGFIILKKKHFKSISDFANVFNKNVNFQSFSFLAFDDKSFNRNRGWKMMSGFDKPIHTRYVTFARSTEKSACTCRTGCFHGVNTCWAYQQLFHFQQTIGDKHTQIRSAKNLRKYTFLKGDCMSVVCTMKNTNDSKCARYICFAKHRRGDTGDLMGDHLLIDSDKYFYIAAFGSRMCNCQNRKGFEFDVKIW